MSRRKEAKQAPKEQVVRPVIGVEDMVLLPDTKDSGIAANLKLRLQSELIYTSIGHVLVVCNPYKWLPIYTEDVMKRYVMQQRVDVPPHVFATAEAAYRNMIQEEDNQCVIISGESGAGKTEASKQIQSYIAKISGGGQKVEQTKKVFLDSNPVLEAFGNAKTLRNNNSSRFGKYFELKFNQYGTPIGGYITNYLLEKSRIINPGKGERNFHIFYQLLKSPMAETLNLKQTASAYNYLSSHTTSSNSTGSSGNNKSDSCEDTVDGMDDQVEMENTLAAMKSVGMKNGQIKSILSLLGAILHLGNIEFETAQIEGVEGCKVVTKASTNSGTALRKCCELLNILPQALCHALTYRELHTTAPGGKVDNYQIPQHCGQAVARRDAIAKAIYEQLFDLIVERINVALDPATTTGGEEVQSKEVLDLEVDVLSIGVLDIYGFEVFKHNGFEQLCINYVNEKLQQIFIQLTLNAEQLEYEEEGIVWKNIPFFNNKIVCDLLDSARPSGLFRVLDDTCKTLHGTKATLDVDRKFLDTAKQLHGSHAHFRAVPNAFVVKHYAGEVTYDCGKLAESNKDALDNDLLGLIKSSEEKLLAHLFRNVQHTQPPASGSNNSGGAAPVVPSAGTRIRQQCQLLVTALMECSPHYVRCVKSNDQKAALTIDTARVQHQVQYLGLSENIKVRRAGYAYRNEYHRFLERFAILSDKTYPEWSGSDLNGCKELLKSISKTALHTTFKLNEEVQLGKSKLFIRSPELYFAIEQLRELSFERFAGRIQRAYRRYRSSRELVSLQSLMHALYSEQRKTRRRESIYCPFSGDTLLQIDAALYEDEHSQAGIKRSSAQEEAVRERFKESMYRIIDHYNTSEVVLFVDTQAAQVIRSSAGSSTVLDSNTVGGNSCCGSSYATVPRVLVLTSAAVYVMETLTPEAWRLKQLVAGVAPAECAAKQMPGSLLLRRRIPFATAPSKTTTTTTNATKRVSHDGSDIGAISGLVMSRLADCALLLQVSTPSAFSVPLTQALLTNKQIWAKNESSNVCSVTGTPFTLFHRRHHCRITGSLVCAAASMHTQLLPDKQLFTPQRVSDPMVGLVSCDPLEDVILLSDRKTEFAALVAAQLLHHRSGQHAKASSQSLGSVIKFSNTLTPQTSAAVPGPFSLIPAEEFHIQEVPVLSRGNKQKKHTTSNSTTTTNTTTSSTSMYVIEDCTLTLETNKKLVFSCPDTGITHQAVVERRERQLQRQKKVEKRRRKEIKARIERALAREKEREELRLQRLAERKVKKLAEKQAKRLRALASAGISPPKPTTSGSGKGGSASSSVGDGGIKHSNSYTRLQPTTTSGTTTSNTTSKQSLRPSHSTGDMHHNSSTTSNTSSMPNAATLSSRSLTPPPTTSTTTNNLSHTRATTSIGNNELMAAMAKRRAKQQQEQ